MLIALALRAGWGLSLAVEAGSIDPLPDQREYLESGRNLLKTGRLQFIDERFGQTISAFRMPGYPLLIAACGANVRAVRLAQALIDTLTVLAVYRLATRYLGGQSALWAAGLAALNPWLIYFTGLLLSETFFVAIIAWALVLLMHRNWFLLGAALLAMGTLVRAEMGPLAIILTMAAALQRRWRLPRVLGAGLLVAAMVCFVLLPWAGRNQRVLGRWIWTTTNTGFTLYDGFNPNANGASDQAFLQTMPELFAPGVGELQRNDLLLRKAWQWALDHPARDLQLALNKIARTWSPWPLSSQYARPLYIAVGLCYSLPLDLLVMAALWQAWRGRGILPRGAAVFLLLPAIYITITHVGSVGSLRYRLPAETTLMVLASSAAVAAIRPTIQPGSRGDGSDADVT